MFGRIALAVLTGHTLVSCGGGRSPVGQWHSTFGGVALELKADHTAAITVVGIPTEGTWEIDSQKRLVVHGRQDLVLTWEEDGSLGDGLGGRFVKEK